MALSLGAHQYIEATEDNVANGLGSMGGAKVVLGTEPTSQGMVQTIPVLSARGQLVVVAVPGKPLSVNATHLIFGASLITGAPTGPLIDYEQTLAFANL